MRHRPRSIPLADLALAYELRTAGIKWRHIAHGLGRKIKPLRHALEYAIRRGVKPHC